LATSGSGTITISGLSPSTSYTFTVYATNSAGNSASSSASNSITTASPSYLYSWGNNQYGQLGLNNRTRYSSPKQVSSTVNWLSVSAGDAYTMAIRKDNNTLWGWGVNYRGQLGLGNITYYSSPKQVGSLTNWLSVATSYSSTLAVKSDGTLWSWGQNQFGQLGLGNTTNYSSPKQVGSLNTWVSVTTGGFVSAAIKSDGTLWTFGLGAYGTLGRGNTSYYSSPVQVGALTTWSKTTSSTYSTILAIKTDGTLWAWGKNNTGQLGLGYTTYAGVKSPIQVGALTDWSQVSSRQRSSLAVKTNNTLWGWGYNYYGQLGLNNTGYYSSPVQVGGSADWSRVETGGDHVAATKTNGTLWGWGTNDNGQIGIGNITNYSSPKQVGSLTSWLSLSCGQYHTVAISSV
jgi:hypothetical protein